MGFWLTIAKKMWNGILDVIAWVTQDSPRLNKAKRKTDPEREASLQRMRSRIGRF